MKAKTNLSALAAVLLACLWLTVATSRAAAGTEQDSGWIRPTATATATYGSIYMVVVGVVQAARIVITAVAPAEWLMAAQVFGIPMVVMPVVMQVGPEIRALAPHVVDRILGES